MKEAYLKKRCLAWLKKNSDGRVWWYAPQDFSHSGIPDLLICFSGRLFWIEFKTEKGRVSEIQKYTHEILKKAGAGGFVCRSFETFLTAMLRIKNEK